MSATYQAVQWTRQKKWYDLTLSGVIVLYLGLFIGISGTLHPEATAETLLIRGFGTAALVLLHVILCIGPLARLDSRFLPLLYNRRHLGVAMFLLALVHGLFSTIQFHALGDAHPLVSLFVANPRIDSISQFPFEPLGFFALLIFFLMAATSHDFWLANLTPPVWKALHMGVYVAYGLVVLHVALGSIQSTTNPALALLLAAGMLLVFTLHWAAGGREKSGDASDLAAVDGWVELCPVDAIPEKRARIFPVAGERVAVFRYDGKLSAISNLCQHQNGPLGEGKIIDGCVTCPWHGFQYRPEDGCAPEPFTEKLPTFNVQIRNASVFIDPKPNPPGTRVEPARIAGAGHGA